VIAAKLVCEIECSTRSTGCIIQTATWTLIMAWSGEPTLYCCNVN
jgi:hypothetical protein